MAKHTIEELRQRQALPLEAKIEMSYARVRDWVDAYGIQGVYISFSGGKDSTVLLDLIRNRYGYPDMKAVFVDVPTQFPELRQFVKTFDNVDIIKPKISFMEVCEKYGFPLISKEVSESVEGARKYLKSIIAEAEAGGGVAVNTHTDTSSRKCKASEISSKTNPRTTKIVRGGDTLINTNTRSLLEQDTSQQTNLQLVEKVARGGVEEYPIKQQSCSEWVDSHQEQLAGTLRANHNISGANKRLAGLMGWLTKDGAIRENTPKNDRSQFSTERYKFFLDAPFEISNKCCKIMKKDPVRRYEKEHGVFGITAQMADESKLRTQVWLENGCNAFDAKHPISNPMSFWTENDVLEYIYKYKLPICSVYGEVVPASDQLTFDDMGFDTGDAPCKKYKTTGRKRTGWIKAAA